MDRDTILKQIERYEKLLAAVGDEAERRSILKLLERNAPSSKTSVEDPASRNSGRRAPANT